MDLAAANRLLDRAGDKRGSGGIRVAQGHPMSYLVLAPDREFAIIQAGAQKLGIRLALRTLDSKAEFAAISANKYRNFDLALPSNTAGGLDPDFNLSSYTCMALGIHTRERLLQPGLRQALPDAGHQPSALQVVAQMQRMLYGQRPVLVLAYPDSRDAWGKQWTGFVESPAGLYNYLVPYSLVGVPRTG